MGRMSAKRQNVLEQEQLIALKRILSYHRVLPAGRALPDQHQCRK